MSPPTYMLPGDGFLQSLINLLLTKMAAAFFRNCFHFLFLWVCSRCYLHMVFMPFYFRFLSVLGEGEWHCTAASPVRWAEMFTLESMQTRIKCEIRCCPSWICQHLFIVVFMNSLVLRLGESFLLTRRNCLSWYSCLRSSLNVRSFYSRSWSSDYVPCRLRNKELCFSSTISAHFSLGKHQGCFRWRYQRASNKNFC